MECPVCCTETSRAACHRLECGDTACVACLTAHVSTRLTAASKGPIACFSCKTHLEPAMILELLSSPEHRDSKKTYTARRAQELNEQLELGMVFCGGANCHLAVKPVSARPQTVRCICGHEFCNHC